ncbi:MAG: hypothetical protein SFX73_26900 [Kofleriaceae bacterium]|nr:hypothetical protein [Kofleriaceae bacterium]
MELALDQLDRTTRAQLAALWRERAVSEASVGSVFVQLVEELVASGAPAAIIELARQAQRDEARHARVCADLAEAYGGTPVELPPARSVRLPDHGQSDVRLRAALHAINLCCISETIASAFVEACLGGCAADALRELHGQHLADEVHHARVGWAYLATLSPSERAAVAPHLPALLDVQLRLWSERIGALPEAGVAGHGYPPRAQLLEAVHAAISELILPGFDHVGVDSAPARARFARSARSAPSCVART